MDTLHMIEIEANTKNFAKTLERAGIKNNRQTASFLINIFATASTKWIKIPVQEWEKQIDFKKNYKSFYEFRNALLKNDVVICQATREELLSDKPQSAAIMFSIGSKSKRYIDKAIQLNLPQRVTIVEGNIQALKEENKADKIQFEIILKENKEIKNKLSLVEEDNQATKEELKQISKKVDQFVQIILKNFPPDTPLRRDIVVKNVSDYNKMSRKLEEEKQQREKHN